MTIAKFHPELCVTVEALTFTHLCHLRNYFQELINRRVLKSVSDNYYGGLATAFRIETDNDGDGNYIVAIRAFNTDGHEIEPFYSTPYLLKRYNDYRERIIEQQADYDKRLKEGTLYSWMSRQELLDLEQWQDIYMGTEALNDEINEEFSNQGFEDHYTQYWHVQDDLPALPAEFNKIVVEMKNYASAD